MWSADPLSQQLRRSLDVQDRLRVPAADSLVELAIRVDLVDDWAVEVALSVEAPHVSERLTVPAAERARIIEGLLRRDAD